MRAVILAAGVGARLGAVEGVQRPKCLLRLGQESLLSRHVRLLRQRGVDRISVVTGYQADRVGAELEALNDDGGLNTVYNAAFHDGSVVSLWTAREQLVGEEDVLLMDADVLYDPRLLDRLIGGDVGDRLLLDRDFEPGEEPVKVCLAAGRPVELRKHLAGELVYDDVGESVGFFRFSPRSAGELAERADEYVRSGRRGEPHEEVIRDMLLADPGRFTCVDVTGLPWIEIDFPEDLVRARQAVLPSLTQP